MFKQHVRKLALLGALGLAVFGATGYRAFAAYAQTSTPPAAQVLVQDCATNQANDATEVNGVADTDLVDMQCGDQTAPDNDVGEAREAVSGPDADSVQQGQGAQVEDGQPDPPGAPLEDAGK